MPQPASHPPTDPSDQKEAQAADLELVSKQKADKAPAKRGKDVGRKDKKQPSKKAQTASKAQQLDDEGEADEQALTVVIGRRLALIRDELGHQRPGNSLSQSQVAKEAGLTQNMIWRLERGLSRNGGLLKLVRYYEKQGYNISWILTEQNFAVSKLLVQQLTVNVDSNYLRLIHRQVEKVVAIQEKATQAMSDLQALLQDMKSGK